MHRREEPWHRWNTADPGTDTPLNHARQNSWQPGFACVDGERTLPNSHCFQYTDQDSPHPKCGFELRAHISRCVHPTARQALHREVMPAQLPKGTTPGQADIRRAHHHAAAQVQGTAAGTAASTIWVTYYGSWLSWAVCSWADASGTWQVL